MMNSGPIMESDMTFGPYPEGTCWHIEKSRTYAKNKQDVSIAEFILLRDNTLWIVEAKSSSPQPGTQPNFDKYILDIQQSMRNSLLMFLGMRLERHDPATNSLSGVFAGVDLDQIGFKLVLVIHGHKGEWLPPLQDAFQHGLVANMRAFGGPKTSISVINDQIAREKGLIQ